jgi:hypothetical protein
MALDSGLFLFIVVGFCLSLSLTHGRRAHSACVVFYEEEAMTPSVPAVSCRGLGFRVRERVCVRACVRASLCGDVTISLLGSTLL